MYNCEYFIAYIRKNLVFQMGTVGESSFRLINAIQVHMLSNLLVKCFLCLFMIVRNQNLFYIKVLGNY